MSQPVWRTHNSVPGGISPPRLPTKEDQRILDKVKREYVEDSRSEPWRFTAVQVRVQVVAGQNYLFKVEVGDDVYVHIKLLVSSSPKNPGPRLVAYQPNKRKEDKLDYF